MVILLDGVGWEPSLFVEGSCFGGDGAQVGADQVHAMQTFILRACGVL